MSSIFLSVVIPCYDEVANLRKGVLDKVKSFLEKEKIAYEIIVVDDGSKDGSIQFVKKFIDDNPEVKIIENKHLGKAGTVTTGMLAGKGEYILFTDMDQATPIEEIDHLLPFLTGKKCDVAIGSRSLGGMGYPASRLFIHEAMILSRKILVGLPTISDTQCGFKLFTHDAAKTIFTKLHTIHHGFKEISSSAVQAGFDVEVLLIAQKLGYRIQEVPVQWLYVESRRVSPIKDSVEGMINLLTIRKNKWKGIY